MTSNSSSIQQHRSWLARGTQLNGTYEIDHPIGTGGMGEIYRAHEIETKQSVAVKLMLPECTQNTTAVALFRKEAAALRQLQHEAIVRYYAFTVAPVLRRPYLVMEFVDGCSLATLLQDHGPLSFFEVHSLIRRLAAGLQAAHVCGIIHRDVSSDNIIIPDGDVSRAKIIDFGIARLTHNDDGTLIGAGFAGKHNYASPEQLGLFGGEVTAQSDIYSLGLVLVEALTGRPIDMGGTPTEVIEKRRKTPDLALVDRRFRALIERMLQPDPQRRPKSMAVVATWSVSKLGEMPTVSDVTCALDHTRRLHLPSGRPARRKWWYAAAASLLISIGVVCFAITSRGWGHYSRPPSDPSTVEQYVAHYDGGECLYVAPVVIRKSGTILEAFASSAQTLASLERDFQRKNGFAASTRWRLVTPAQCAAVTFLSRLRGTPLRPPRLSIDQSSVGLDEALTGMIDGLGERGHELLLISDAGLVTNVSRLLEPRIDAANFHIAMRNFDGAAGQPQLAMSIASRRRLNVMHSAEPILARQFFPQTLTEAATTDQPLSATARQFLLVKTTTLRSF